MKANNIDELIKALRCSARVKTNEDKCEECPYRTLEEVSDKIPCPSDVEIDGIKYWEGCDCDTIATDSADMLEKLKQAAGA